MEFGADKTDVKSLSLEELQAEMVNIGEKPFRAKQLYEWFHKKLARDYDEMRNIPKSLKEKLESGYTYTSLKIVEVQTSQIDGTKKYLFSLADGNLVESVWMQYHHGNSVCISYRWGAVWDVNSVRRQLADWSGVLRPPRCLTKFMPYQGTRGNAFPTWS